MTDATQVTSIELPLRASAVARATAVAAKASIGDLGGAWMTSELEEAAGSAVGFDDWELYFLGRHGVLGDVDPEVVRAAAYVFSIERVRDQWERARAVMTPHEAVQRYLGVCHEWGRQRLAGFSDAERLVALGRRVVDAVDVVAMPLFAGWRVLPMPEGGEDRAAERCIQICQLLREHRGAAHGIALGAVQLDPLIAILTNPARDDTGASVGEGNAREYGWPEPFPTVTDADRVRRDAAEQLTDDIVAVAYDALSEAELNELLALLEAAHQQAFGV